MRFHRLTIILYEVVSQYPCSTTAEFEQTLSFELFVFFMFMCTYILSHLTQVYFHAGLESFWKYQVVHMHILRPLSNTALIP